MSQCEDVLMLFIQTSRVGPYGHWVLIVDRKQVIGLSNFLLLLTLFSVSQCQLFMTQGHLK